MSEIQGHHAEWAAVVISVAAAGIAFWQAVIARRQAHTAEEAAELAERQATAAEAQVDIMRQQLDAENADRHDSRRPQFQIEAGPLCDAGQDQPYAEVMLTQTAGRPLQQVTVEAAGQYVQGLRTGRRSGEYDQYPVGEATIDGMSQGGSPELLQVHFDYRHATPIRVAMTLHCIAREGGHVWVERLTATVEEAPEAARAPSGRRARRRAAGF
ncbi:hypothetical protein OHA79_01330 [Streptomyces sp. NBC_00841]|uniref:hypothetical protein n=1 Tax=Streptomyces sp. NBC_00841 TaxID=2975847 RepID=UPI002DD8D34E|nr:hypothetical protein [Streptomyces sp. NBC_00841]WRZ96708.1 hypothetical protein OHA79_01330 [Streptomyces sp. NBC_00841]